jgi:hypothetical protein
MANKHTPFAPLPREDIRFNCATGAYEIVQEATEAKWPLWLRIPFIAALSGLGWAGILFLLVEFTR